MGRISGWGWGLGYLGGVIALSIALFGFVKAEPSWLNTATLEQVRICGPLVAIWIALFALPLFFMVPDYPASDLRMSHAIRHGLHDLWQTLKTLPQQKNILIFLIAQMIYNDGLVTIFAFGGIYAAGTFHMNMTNILLFGIYMNVSAGVGSILLAWIDDFLGAKFTILLSLLFLAVFGFGIVIVTSILDFWILAGLFGLFVGPVQSSSRSLMARLVPKTQATKMFGLYTFAGKVSTFIGPWVLGIVTLSFNSQRFGMGAVLLFFAIGAAILGFVQPPASAIANR